MKQLNKYCCRCHQTTRFEVAGNVYTCTQCHVQVEVADRTEQRQLIGNPLRVFKTSLVG